ncbi:MBL fold metallo-hydrolase [Shinella granuli]|uniref:Cft2 family RNA processing exonuclease n=1 Tax=Shinella granuli TaxID=323621 RepID=A0A4R2C082_SHIGR|nr:MBL fold metallo-hydrolase [Shinella granuli]TCN33526.1 Cft2 family RNA processing exonuclease [Shinella granuli]
MKASITPISGFGAKGPACFLLEAEGRRILLDFGQGPDHDALPDFDRIGSVDALVLSHGHRDHLGAIGHIGRIGNPKVYATQAIHESLAGLDLMAPLPLRGESDILGIKVETGRTGHAPGGVWLNFRLGGGFLYTGDYCQTSPLYAYDMPGHAKVAIIDASYGADERTVGAAQSELLAAVGKRPCLIPSPPDGRGPEIALHLYESGFEIGLDEATAQSIRRLIAFPDSLRLGVKEQLEQLLAAFCTVHADSVPAQAMIVAGASGSLPLVKALLERWQDGEDVGFIFTGHLPNGSPAEKLVGSGRAEVIRWNVHPGLAETRALIDAVRPDRIIPAFAPPDRLQQLRSACPAPFEMEGHAVAIT